MALKILRMKSGWASNAHFTTLYPMPDGPRANLFDIPERAVVTSSCVMG